MQAPSKSYFRTHLIPEYASTKMLSDSKSEVLKLLASYITDPSNKEKALAGLASIQASLPPESKTGSYNSSLCAPCSTC